VADFFASPGLLIALIGGAATSVLLEQLLTPAPMLRRPIASWLLHFGMWLLAFCFEMSLFQRPWFAAAFVLAFLLFVVLVSNAKFGSLREPFIFSDFEYFTDTLRHPRLYIPFLGWWRAALAMAGFIAAVWIGLAFEAPLTRQFGVATFYQGVGWIALCGAGLVTLGAWALGPASFKPVEDLRRMGLIGSLWRYMAAELKPIDHAALQTVFNAAPPLAAKPNIVVVQSESFFDVRRLYSGIERKVLQQWDRLQRDSLQHGRLQVAAWGANTVRTEFSFLSGLETGALGVHQFNPYRQLARAGIATLASHLREQGYRTVCVHPYPASFYKRDIVFPLVGFDEFIDIEKFDIADKAGPYIGDVAVAEKIAALVESGEQPLFIFAITMENHGPLHWEKLTPDERKQHFGEAPPAGCDDLAVYLRHLANADKMAGMLRDHLAASPSPAWLCFYGDHVPIMADVYAQLGEPDGTTDYVIWSNRQDAEKSQTRDLGVAELAGTLLEHVRGTQRKNT